MRCRIVLSLGCRTVRGALGSDWLTANQRPRRLCHATPSESGARPLPEMRTGEVNSGIQVLTPCGRHKPRAPAVWCRNVVPHKVVHWHWACDPPPKAYPKTATHPGRFNLQPVPAVPIYLSVPQFLSRHIVLQYSSFLIHHVIVAKQHGRRQRQWRRETSSYRGGEEAEPHCLW